MILLKDVLVATDFSPPSEAALRYGRALAGRFGATLHVIHAVENPFLRPTAASPAEIEAGAHRTIERRFSQTDRDVLRARSIVEVSDNPAEAIVDYGRDSNIDLVVMGTLGRRTAARFLIGSVAARVVRTASCPVLTVRQPEHEFVEENAMIALKQVVVATDFGEAAEAALSYGREFARTFGAKLVLLHVVEDVLTRPFAAEAFTTSYPQLQQEIEAASKEQLDAALTDDDRRTLSAEAVMLRSNQPADAIAAYAAERNADILITGTHGRGAVAHMLMGSVAERLVRTAPCPVLTVRHPEHEFIGPDALVAVAKA